ncbi:hypothetical protein L596_001450 [Steinernema carpocapsae]|uniref:Uncharacterized protein n=1 Tax=Steinernema carpocapsae TaxID=34508 RepID=A0A4U8ULT9_STECR|nr:hypothetical protein L596_001450 [Steinernema carpocapsae]
MKPGVVLSLLFTESMIACCRRCQKSASVVSTVLPVLVIGLCLWPATTRGLSKWKKEEENGFGWLTHLIELFLTAFSDFSEERGTRGRGARTRYRRRREHIV